MPARELTKGSKMALAHVFYELTVSLADCAANMTTKRYRLRSIDMATAVIDTATIISALGAVTASTIISYRIQDVFYEGSVVYPAAGVKNSDKASVTVILATGGGKKANFKIPAPVIGIFSSATGPKADEVDIEDADLNTYHNIFQADGECFISDGEDSVDMMNGVRISAARIHG